VSVHRLVWKVTRPEGFALCFACAWLMANLSQTDSDLMFSVSVVSGLSCLGSSIFHFGAGHRIYSRKAEAIKIARPWILILTGAFILALSVGISLAALPPLCTATLLFNATSVSVYSVWLSKRWYIKNPLIATVCTTPALLGSLVGTTTHPATWYILTSVYCTFLSREIIKDVEDIIANHGRRVTLPMVIGISGALKIAAVAAMVGAMSVFLLRDYLWTADISVGILAITAGCLWTAKYPIKPQRLITIGMATLMLSVI
jgi:4-hydroxybenzoate polyprenyltransferase